MNKPAVRLAALSLGFVVAGAAAATAAMMLPPNPVKAYLLFAKEQVLPGPETRLRERAPRRKEQVLAEIARLGDHAWAGVYRTAGRWPHELAIAPESGFTLYQGSWCGNCAGWRGAGRVLSTQGPRLQLLIELDSPEDRSSARYHLDESLHFVRWGDLCFAVPAWRMESFCAEASNRYTFPDVTFRYLGGLADFDFEKPPRPDGKPLIPSEFRHLVLDEPIAGRVVAFVDWRLRSDGGSDRKLYDAVYSTDVGSKDGLAVGMRFYVEGVKRSAKFSGRVEHVDASTGRFQMLAYEGERDWAEGIVGKRATTLHPEAVKR